MSPILPQRKLRPDQSSVSSHEEAYNPQWLFSVISQALDQLAVGVIIADGSSAIVEMNRAGKTIVRLEDGLLVRNYRLCARRSFETAKIAGLIAAATAEGNSGATAGRMLVGRGNSLPAYVLTVAPLRTGLAVDEQHLALIVVVDPMRHSPSQRELAEFFQLSPAEARVAVALLTGKTLVQIATDFGIRITTARTQLASILRKVGADRQSDLVRILSSTGIGSLSFATGCFDLGFTVLEIPLPLAGM